MDLGTVFARERAGRVLLESSRRSARSVSRAALAALVLSIPASAVANPVDPTWDAGWYDDADTDQLVTQTMSADGLIGMTFVTPLGLCASALIVPLPVRGCRPAGGDGPGLRAPPRRVAMPSDAVSRAAPGRRHPPRSSEELSVILVGPPSSS